MPSELADNVENSNFSQESIQKISDHIGYFLGIGFLRSVRVKVVQEYPGERWISTSDGSLKRDTMGSPVPGFYKANSLHSEIEIIRMPTFKLKHILAILAHESTHNYLFYYGVRELDDAENEILTDVTAAYLGSGHLLIEGYESFSQFFGYYTVYTSIGYLTPASICDAIIESTKFRLWDSEEIASIPNLSDFNKAILRKGVEREISKLEREKRKADNFRQKQMRTINILTNKVSLIQLNYKQVYELMQRLSRSHDISISPNDGRTLVEIANKVSLGEIDSEIKKIQETIHNLKNSSSISKSDVKHLSNHVNHLFKAILSGRKLLNKYVQ